MILLAPIKYLAGVTNISGQSVASFPEENLRTNLTGELLVIPPQAVFFLGNVSQCSTIRIIYLNSPVVYLLVTILGNPIWPTSEALGLFWSSRSWKFVRSSH